MSVMELTEETFDKEVLQEKKLVIVDFWATWCTPCQMLSPVLEEAAAERSSIKFCKLNVDEAPNIAEKYGIMSIPALLFFEGGEIVNESIGVISKEELLRLLPE